MQSKAIILLLLALVGMVRAEPPPGYYAALEGKQGAELRAAVHQATTNQFSSFPRDLVQDAVARVDAFSECRGAVFACYGGGILAGLNYNDCGLDTGWEVERFWPLGYGVTQLGPATIDLHNMRPAHWQDIRARGLRIFGPHFTPPPTKPNHFPLPQTNIFLPPIADRGLIARAMFYMDIRYDGEHGYPDLQLVDDTRLIQTNAPYFGRLSTLVAWHKAAPVTERERLRNDRVFASQKNRNPFVDRPELVDAIYGVALASRHEGTNLVLTWPVTLDVYFVDSRTLRGRGSAGRFPHDGTNYHFTTPLTAPKQFFWLEAVTHNP